jgi:hypothetical protein
MTRRGRCYRQAPALAQRTGERRAEADNLIGLATTVQYADRRIEAERLIRQALAGAAEDTSGYQDFALRRLGRCRLEIGSVSEAVGCFERALALREAKGDFKLIGCTLRALAAAQHWSTASIREGNNLVQRL